MCRPEAGVNLQGALVVVDGFGGEAFESQHVGQTVLCFREVRLRPRGGLKLLERLVVFLLCRERDPVTIVRQRVNWIVVNRFAETIFRFCEITSGGEQVGQVVVRRREIRLDSDRACDRRLPRPNGRRPPGARLLDC